MNLRPLLFLLTRSRTESVRSYSIRLFASLTLSLVVMFLDGGHLVLGVRLGPAQFNLGLILWDKWS